MKYQDQSLNRLIRAVQYRRRWVAFLKGAAIVSSIGAASLFLMGWLAYRYGTNTGLLISLRLITTTILIAVIYFFIVRPLRQYTKEANIARLIEERHTGSEDRLVSAVEFRQAAEPLSKAIIHRLVNDADRFASDIKVDEIIPKNKFWQWGLMTTTAIALSFGILFFGSREISNGIQQLLAPDSSAAMANTMSVSVNPGNARVPKNSDQRILATLNNFYAEPVTLFWRKSSSKDNEWASQVMEAAKNKSDFQSYFFNIQDSVEYFVESNEIKTDIYKLEVVDLPYVKRIDLELNYPNYTGLPAKTIENGAKITALAETNVRVTAQLTAKAKSARIVLNDKTKIEMKPQGENDFVGYLTVKRDGSYHIELVSFDGETYRGSSEYDIALLADQPPIVSFEKPGCDTRATSVEEVFTQVKAEDDYSISSLDLHFSINGGEEHKVNLQKLKSAAARTMTGVHTFFLEEYGLKPGDFISYYAKARDAKSEASSDIYFIEIKPFEREYRQSQQSGGSGKEQEENALSKRQKELIAATFRIQREEDNYSEEQKKENYNTVGLGQEKLRDDTHSLIDRIKRRLGEQLDDRGEFTKLVEHLTQASKEMDEALAALKNEHSKEALPAEQRALQQLLRADSIFREIQVAFAESGENSNQSAEELADLFELELDKMKNQYETLRREQRQQVQQQEDETKRKLEELARRQQQEVERQQRRMQGQPHNSGNSSGSRQQQQLIDETRKTARELDRLSRERRDPQLMQLSQQLKQAAEEMRAAAQNNDQTESITQNLQALQKLEDVQRRLQQSQHSSNKQAVGELRQRATSAAARQREITNQIEEIIQHELSTSNSQDIKQQLAERKEQLANEINHLERDIEQTARGFGSNQQQTADQLREATNSLRRNRVADRIRATKQMLQNNLMDAARAGEHVIQQNLDKLAHQLQEAEKTASQHNRSDAIEEALDQTRQLADNLESLRQKLSQRGQQNDQSRQSDRPNEQAISDGRQLSAELKERLREAEQLQRDLKRERNVSGRGLNQAIQALRQMSNSQYHDDTQTAALLKSQVIVPLREVEVELSRSVQTKLGRNNLHLAEQGKAPARYRKLVEEYYRRLSNRTIAPLTSP